MKMRNNTDKNKVTTDQKYLDTNLLVNSLEDGNASIENPIQGSLYTAEINSFGYNKAYYARIASVSSESTRTGNNNFFKITVNYDVTSSFSAGWFGNSLLKEGEPFIVHIYGTGSPTDFEPLKGYIVKIYSSVAVGTNPTVVTYEVLVCITEGNYVDLYSPLVKRLYTNRRLFDEEKLDPPVNLMSTYNLTNNTLTFFFDDISHNANGYRIDIRREGMLSSFSSYNLTGNSPNFKGIMSPLVFPGVLSDGISAIRIDDPGYGLSTSFFSCTFAANCTSLPTANFITDDAGRVSISEFKIYSASYVSSKQASFRIKIEGANPSTIGLSNQYFDAREYGFSDGCILSYTTSDNIWFNVTVAFLNNMPYTTSANLSNALLKKVITIHTGCFITSYGSGLSKPPKMIYDKYPENSKFATSFPGIPRTYYWKVASLFGVDQKKSSKWSEEYKLIIS
jgi:hypothetical protein